MRVAARTRRTREARTPRTAREPTREPGQKSSPSGENVNVELLTVSPVHIEDAVERVFERACARPSGPQSVLWICPNHRLVRVRLAQYASFLASRGYSAARMPWFAALNDLALELAKSALPGTRVLNRFESRLIVRDVVARERFDGSLAQPGFALRPSIEPLTKASLNFIHEAKSHLFPRGEGARDAVRRIEDAIDRSAEEDFPGIDIGRWDRLRRRAAYPARVLVAYEDELAARNACDVDDTLRAVGETLPWNVEEIVIDSFLDFDPHEEVFLARLMRALERAGGTQCSVIASSFPVFSFSDGPIEAREAGVDASRALVEKCGVGPVERVRADEVHLSARQSTQPVPVSIDAFESATEEAQVVAKRARELVCAGADPARIAIIYPELEKTAPFIAQALEAEGVAYNVSRGKPVSSSPIGRLFITVLECVMLGYDPALFCEIVSHCENHLFSETEKARVIDTVYRLPLWLGEGSLEAIAKRAAAEEWPETSKIDAVREALGCVRAARTYGEISAALIEFGKLLGVFDDRDRDPESSAALEATVEALRSLERTDAARSEYSKAGVSGVLLAEDAGGAPGAARTKESGAGQRASSTRSGREAGEELLRTALELYTVALDEYAVSVPGDVAEGVQVTGILETRGDSFDFVFLAGFTDDAFPGQPAKDVFLPDRIRERIGLPGRADFFAKKKEDFWRLVHAARAGVFISWYRLDARTEHIRSRFVEELAILLENGLEGFAKVEWGLAPPGAPSAPPEGRPVGRLAPPDGGARRRISVSTLVSFLKCPVRAIARLHGIDERELPSEEISDREFGSLFHRIVSATLTDLHAEGSIASLRELAHAGRQEDAANHLRKALEARVRPTVEAWFVEQGYYVSRYGAWVDRLARRLARHAHALAPSLAGILGTSSLIYSEKELSVQMGDYEVTGRIDLLALDADGMGSHAVTAATDDAIEAPGLALLEGRGPGTPADLESRKHFSRRSSEAEAPATSATRDASSDFSEEADGALSGAGDPPSRANAQPPRFDQREMTSAGELLPPGKAHIIDLKVRQVRTGIDNDDVQQLSFYREMLEAVEPGIQVIETSILAIDEHESKLATRKTRKDPVSLAEAVEQFVRFSEDPDSWPGPTGSGCYGCRLAEYCPEDKRRGW
jgi:superfamily I DNA/RNA helicase